MVMADFNEYVSLEDFNKFVLAVSGEFERMREAFGGIRDGVIALVAAMEQMEERLIALERVEEERYL